MVGHAVRYQHTLTCAASRRGVPSPFAVHCHQTIIQIVRIAGLRRLQTHPQAQLRRVHCPTRWGGCPARGRPRTAGREPVQRWQAWRRCRRCQREVLRGEHGPAECVRPGSAWRALLPCSWGFGKSVCVSASVSSHVLRAVVSRVPRSCRHTVSRSQVRKLNVRVMLRT